MDSAVLLVVDQSPECAENINSLLRNSGINVHVKFASDLTAARSGLDETRPFLVIYNESAAHSVHIEEILPLAREFNIPLAIRFRPQAPEVLVTALQYDYCVAVSADDELQLCNLVRRRMQAGHTAAERARTQQKMSELEDRYQLLLDSARDSIAYIHEGLHVYANRAYLESMQVGAFAEIAGLSLLELMRGSDVDLKKLLRDMQKGVFPGKPVTVTVTNPSGTQFQGELAFSPARYEGEDCVQMVMHKKDANAILMEELDRLRHTDQLTQMTNRKAFTEQLEAYIEAERGSELSSAVFYLEPDGTADLLSELGVAGMDSFIADLAQLIRQCIGPEDLPARLSDHGFALLVRREESTSVKQVGECIVQGFGNHVIELEDKTITASCSAGMATIGSLTHSADEVLAQAYSAHAEAAGTGGCLVRFKPQLTTVASDEKDKHWVERIRYALNNRDLYSIQQSIVNLEGESEGLFENRTFLREEGGDRRPEEFLPAAERNDLASSIDRYVIPGLLKAISGTGDRHIINLSGNSVMDFSFPSWFHHQLEENDVEGTQIILQFTASAAAAHLKPTQRMIEELRPLGCAFSISQFNDQRTTLSLLGQLEVDLVKLVPGMAHGIHNNSEQLHAIKAIVDETDPAGVQVIADEVQDAADLAVLWQCGVKLVAGEFLREAPQVVGQ